MTAPPPYPAFSDETADPVARRRRDTIIRTIWSTRTDLQELGARDPDWFQWWLLMHGEEEYKALAEEPLVVSPAWLREPAAGALPGVLPVLTRFMRFIWSMRPDLKSVYDLADPAGQQGFVWWYFLQGAVDHQFGRFFTAEQKAFLNQPAAISSEGTPVPLTRMMMHIHAGRPDLRQAFPLATADGRESFIRWYFLNGVAELNLLDMVDEAQCAALRQPSPAAPGLPHLLYWVWQVDADLRCRFADPQSGKLLSWAQGEGVGHYPILGRVLSQPPQEQVATPATRQSPVPSRPGVNLIGYARGQFGIGEDVRMAALALRAAGISCSILDIAPGNGASQGDLSAAEFITEGLPHTVNLLCMTGMDMARLQATEGNTLLTGRPVIGYWPWELPAWPAEWHHAYDMVDEVWASSRYTYNAYIQDSPKPVRHMPMAVATDATANLRRAQLGLPEQKLLFLFIFDSLSMLARKNPLACVRAFKSAFPAGSEPVGLVLKTMRATMAAQEWALIDAEIGDDPRITIIRQTLDRGAVLDLFRACDIFVSLHRAEGFGRAIAEAMMLGLPVITTGFSGNLDFTTPGTAALVDHRMRPVQEGEYPFGVGQVWAEPDIDHAAWWMRRLAGDTVARRRLARAGQQLVRDSYSPQAVGQHYRAVLARFGI